MSKLKKVKNDSLFKVKDENDDCQNIEVVEAMNAQTGDSTNPNNSPEYIEARIQAEKFLATYKAKTPSDYTEVTDDTLIHYFGKNWQGSFPNCNKTISRRASIAKTQLVWYNEIFDYISNPALVPSGLTKYSNMLAQIKGSYYGIMSDVNGIKSCLNNLKSFKFQTENPMAILNSTDYALANLEYMFTKVDGLVDHCMVAYDRITKELGDIDFSSISDFADSGGKKINEAWEGITTNLANLPATLLNKFLNCAFVQNMMQLPLRVFGYVMSAIGMVMSITAPTSLKDVIAIFGVLRQAVSQMKNAMGVIQNAINQVKQVANMIKSGNWFGMLAMLNTKGNASGPPGFKLVENPSSFAAKYPQNSAYTTSGGHTIEVDNTKGHERLHIEHKTGTSFEMATSGDLLGKVRKNFQTMISGDCEISSQGNMHLHAAKKLELTFNELKCETSKNLQLTGSSINLMCGTLLPTETLTTGAYATLIGSTSTTTISSMKTTSITSNKIVDISTGKDFGIVAITAPELLINVGRLTINTLTTTMINTGGAFASLCGAASVIYSSSANNLFSTGANNIKAPINIIGGI